MIMQLVKIENLRNVLLNFNNILWKEKIFILWKSALDLKYLHNLGYVHKDFHSGNILKDSLFYISDFGLSRPVNEQDSNNRIYGVLPCIAPEVLNGQLYTLS